MFLSSSAATRRVQPDDKAGSLAVNVLLLRFLPRGTCVDAACACTTSHLTQVSWHWCPAIHTLGTSPRPPQCSPGKVNQPPSAHPPSSLADRQLAQYRPYLLGSPRDTPPIQFNPFQPHRPRHCTRDQPRLDDDPMQGPVCFIWLAWVGSGPTRAPCRSNTTRVTHQRKRQLLMGYGAPRTLLILFKRSLRLRL